MSDRIERACARCGSFLHHEDKCDVVRDGATDGMREEIARLKVQLERADGQFRAADLERNTLAAKCNELGVRLEDAIAKLDGMRGERDSEREIAQQWERKYEETDAGFQRLTEILHEMHDTGSAAVIGVLDEVKRRVALDEATTDEIA